MMKYIKENWVFFLFMIIVCIIGGYFTTIYSLQTIDQNLLDEAVKQVGSKEVVIGITVLQISVYAIVFAGIGIILSNKIGLWKKFELNKKAMLSITIISVVGGLVLSVLDKYVFGALIDGVSSFYNSKPTIEYVISSFTYGGVFEEILMRLFLMSLLSFIIFKIFYRKKEKVPIKVFVISNIICAILFAAGHIPATIQLFGHLDALILFRCFLLNGALGIAFGWLYRKYGIGYSMLAHFGCHLISKVIWILFI